MEIDAKIAELERQLAELKKRQAGEDGDGGAREGSGRSISIRRDADGSILITGDHNQVIAADKAEPELLLRAWRSWLAGDCDRMPFGIIDTQFALDGTERRVRLDEVFVEPDVTSSGRPEKEGEERDWAWRLVRGEAGGRRPASEALGKSRRCVLLGDPGSGKTTFAHHLCRSLAAEEDVPEAWRGLLPVRFILREVAELATDDGESGAVGILWKALGAELGRVLGEAAGARLLDHVQEQILEKGALVVLDGLDEVAAAGGRRQRVVDAVAQLATMLEPGPSRLLVTARPYAYVDPRWHLDGFEVLALAPFRHQQVERFIDGWYLDAARRAFTWPAQEAEARARQLRAALEARPYLGDLASRPLLLTLMTTLHSSWGTLPDDRADLYEETVKLLLGRWQRAREVKRGGERIREGSLSRLLDVDERRLRAALEELAFTVHARQAGEEERDGEPADIRKGELLEAFEPLLGEVKPEELWRYLEDRAGLLIERRTGIWAFPHRSFQEFLAACHLGNLPEPSEQVRELAYEDPSWWREVVALAIGRERRNGLGRAVALVTALQPEGPEEVEEVREVDGRVAVICGQALREMRLDEGGEARQPQYRAVLERARRWLRLVVEEGRLPAKERLEAGDVLGRLGDPRPGVGVADGLPAIEWREVEEGAFLMGSAADDSLADKDEKPQREVDLERFWISRYPITNAQFRPFVEAGGYEEQDYWTEAGWAWRRGAEVDVSVYPERLREEAKKWFAGRPEEKRDRPFFWDDERLAQPTRPVVGVTWYEALAYCRWLESRAEGWPGLPAAAGKLRVLLPSEAQWEKAARGTDGRGWPWGDKFYAERCNSKEHELGQPSPVGIFPGGESPCGAADMAGNVWEWTTTVWSANDFYQADFVYPYAMNDHRDDVNGEYFRIVRGGSFYHDRKFARCASRFRVHPDDFLGLIGFRVVLSLAVSDS